MAFKKVFSQIPACSIGHTVNNTLSCLKCDMMHIGSNMKLYVPEDQAVPVRAEANATALEAGQSIACKVTYSDTVTKEEIKTIVGQGLTVTSVEVADTVATVNVRAEAGIYGPRSIIVGYKGVNRIFSVELVKPAETAVPKIKSVTAEPAEVEVGEKAVVTVEFEKEVTKA